MGRALNRSARSSPSRSSVGAVVLVGFMGSGKSSVGSRLAERLGWPFLDADTEVESCTGSSIDELFRDVGEEGFREVEAQVTTNLLERRPLVLATGGGWPAVEPGRLEALPDDVFTVWLRVDPGVAVGRVTASRGRPLLDVEDPLALARDLLDRREVAYRAARLHLDANEVTPDALAEEIVRHLSDAEN